MSIYIGIQYILLIEILL